MAELQTLIDKVESCKEFLIGAATGAEKNDAVYKEYRTELLAESLLTGKLPTFIKSCRTMGEFWRFIQSSFATYRDRRTFLSNEFEIVLTLLESQLNLNPGEKDAFLLTTIDAVNVQCAWDKAIQRRQSDPEGAITMARTLLESVCKYILDETGQFYESTDDLPKLYKLTAQQLNLSPSQHEEQIFRQILGSAASVVDGLGALRNKLSDAHGRGKASAKPSPRHAQLAVNLAGAVATFLIETFEHQRNKKAEAT